MTIETTPAPTPKGDTMSRDYIHDALEMIGHVGVAARLRMHLDSLESRALAAEAERDALRAALTEALPALEDLERENLVGHEGCLWPVEILRDALADTPAPASPWVDCAEDLVGEVTHWLPLSALPPLPKEASHVRAREGGER